MIVNTLEYMYGYLARKRGRRMTTKDAIEQFQNAVDLIKQNGKDWLDERDIPLLDMAIKALKQTDGDLISRKAVVDYVQSFIQEIITESGVDKNAHTNEVLRQVAKGVEELPTIPEVVCDDDCEHCSWVECPLVYKESEYKEQTNTAEWVLIGMIPNNICPVFQCSKCGKKIGIDYNFCPECGAKMKGDKE